MNSWCCFKVAGASGHEADQCWRYNSLIWSKGHSGRAMDAGKKALGGLRGEFLGTVAG